MKVTVTIPLPPGQVGPVIDWGTVALGVLFFPNITPPGAGTPFTCGVLTPATEPVEFTVPVELSPELVQKLRDAPVMG